MKSLKLGLIQMKCEKGELWDNIGFMDKYIELCADNNADIACFPEMNITGYVNPYNHPQVVLPREHEAIKHAAEMSGKYNITVIAGFIEENSLGKPFITQVVAQDGKVQGFYRKRTIVDEEAQWFSPGDGIAIFERNGIKFGVAICADIDDGSIFKEYAENGVDIVFECAAPGLYGEQQKRNWQSGFNWWKGECINKLGSYAKENRIYIAVATQAGRTTDEDFPGGGYLFTREGKCACQTENWDEGVIYTSIYKEVII